MIHSLTHSLTSAKVKLSALPLVKLNQMIRKILSLFTDQKNLSVKTIKLTTDLQSLKQWFAETNHHRTG